MPGTAEKIAAQLNTSLRSFEECTTFGGYISGSKVTEKPEILFARLDVKEVLERQQRCLRRVRHWRKRLRKKRRGRDGADEKPEITFEDFERCSSRLAKSSNANRFRSLKSFSAPR